MHLDFTWICITIQRSARGLIFTMMQSSLTLGQNPVDRSSAEGIQTPELRFFDLPTCDAIKSLIVPNIIRNRKPGVPIRVWVPGCGSGEEVWSILMSLLDALNCSPSELRIFATDANPELVRRARMAVFPAEIKEHVLTSRLERYFQPTATGYQLKSDLISYSVFAKHDILNDPPFAKLDLISCHNPAYFEAGMFKRIVPLFHYGLRETGHLMLGQSKLMQRFSDLFSLCHAQKNIYCKNIPSEPHVYHFPSGKYIHSAGESQLPTAFDSDANIAGIMNSQELKSHDLDAALAQTQEQLRTADSELTAINEELANRNRQLGQLNADLHNILQSTDIPIVVVDNLLRIRLFKTTAERTLNLIQTDIGRPIGDIKLQMKVPNLEWMLRDVISTGNVTSIPVQNRDGRWFTLRIHRYIDADQQINGAVMALVDIDDLHTAQEHEHRARAEAERLNKVKDEFIATLSHELRTPLTPMLSWVRMLRSQALDQQATNRGLEIIERNIKLQAKLIDDLLDLSRIVTGKLHLLVRPANLHDVVSAAVDAVRPTAEAKAIRLDVNLANLPSMLIDPERMQQVFWNLLFNAVKFTPREGSISITLAAVGDRARITVADNGEGIDPTVLPHIFDRFLQADSSTSRKHGGMGIGLSLVRSLTELHGGEVSAESAGQGKGSVFTVSIPINKSAGIDVERPELPPTAIVKGLRALVVEDNAEARDSMALVLQNAGMEVKTAASANEALQILELDRPDIIISDIGMPGMDGFGLLARIRAFSDERRNIPAIAVTAYATRADREKALKAGFHAHVTKPAEPDELLSAVANAVPRPSPAF